MELDVEIWPTSIVVPAGHRIGLSIAARTTNTGCERRPALKLQEQLKGCGPFLHNDPLDRPKNIFGGVTSLYFGGARQPYLLLPVIPPARPNDRRKPKTRGRARKR